MFESALRLRPRAQAALLLLCGLLLCPFVVPSLPAHADARAALAHASATVRAHASSFFYTGIGDEQTEMFGDPNWQRLHTKIARYIAPYDAVVHPYSLSQARAWIHDAEVEHQQVLIAFYHSEYSPTGMPSLALYQRDVQKFMKIFPHVRQYEPWNEANRGNILHVLASPTAVQSAQYYQVVKRACHSCTVVGLDILDQQNVSPTLEYIAEFKREISRLRTIMPSIWGLHNYSDTNRNSTLRTRAVLAAVPGDVWLTETGGVVKFGGAFPNVRGSGLRRAAGALSFMFNIAGTQSRIKRLYIYDWHGGTGSTRFDAGLTDAHYRPRPGYLVVCRRLRAAGCSRVKISSR
jgi:hypothetical protein